WNMTTFVSEINTVCPSCAGSPTACTIKGCTAPPDPTCGAVDIGSIRISKCNNIYSDNLVANNVNPNGPGCWEGLNTTCTGTGCSRDVCNWEGAVAACNELNGGIDYGTKNWRLATRDEMKQWRVDPAISSNIITSVKTDLDLCDQGSGYFPFCGPYSGCPGTNGTCYSYILWTSEASSASNHYNCLLHDDRWIGPLSYSSTWAFSVRCVRNL
ncbi:MAG: hypothetical protein ACD_20C00162G0001, partial [uncultured bacterium]